jgi:hypothetical protein
MNLIALPFTVENAQSRSKKGVKETFPPDVGHFDFTFVQFALAKCLHFSHIRDKSGAGSLITAKVARAAGENSKETLFSF